MQIIKTNPAFHFNGLIFYVDYLSVCKDCCLTLSVYQLQLNIRDFHQSFKIIFFKSQKIGRAEPVNSFISQLNLIHSQHTVLFSVDFCTLWSM